MSFAKFSDLGSKFLLIITTFFAPTFILMAIVGLAILLDTITGRWAAKHFARKEGKVVREEVTSKKTRLGTLSKVITYNLVVITVFLIDYAMINEVVLNYLPFEYMITKLSVLFLCWMEFDSIDEKYYRVKGVTLKDKIREFFRSAKVTIQNIFDLKKDLTKHGNKKDQH